MNHPNYPCRSNFSGLRNKINIVVNEIWHLHLRNLAHTLTWSQLTLPDCSVSVANPTDIWQLESYDLRCDAFNNCHVLVVVSKTASIVSLKLLSTTMRRAMHFLQFP